MSIHPQYTYDKDGKAVGVFIPIDEWNEISQAFETELSQWQKDALDIELKAMEINPESFVRWDDVKKQLLH